MAFAQATALLFTRACDVADAPALDPKFEDLIRFEVYPSLATGPCAADKERAAVNMGVHEGLACGANLEIPAKWLDLSGAIELDGWLLLDLTDGSRRANPPQWEGRIEDVSLRGSWRCGRPA